MPAAPQRGWRQEIAMHWNWRDLPADCGIDPGMPWYSARDRLDYAVEFQPDWTCLASAPSPEADDGD